jgi:hypothetical protein
MNKITFFFEKKHFYLICLVLILALNKIYEEIIENKLIKPHKITTGLYLFYNKVFGYIGQSLLLIPYTIYYYKNKANDKNYTLKEKKIMEILSLLYKKKGILKKYSLNFLLFSTFILSLMEIFTSVFQESIIKSVIKNSSVAVANYLEIQICIIFFSDPIFFNKKLYSHQYLSFFCFLIFLIIKFIKNAIDLEFLKVLYDFFYNIIYYFFVGLRLVLLKYLIDYFYINGYVLLGIEGLYDLIFYIIFYYFSFGSEKNIFKTKYWILFFIRIFLNFIIQIFFIITITVFEPIFCAFSTCPILIFSYIFEKKFNKNIFINSLVIIIYCFFILIFSEIIQLNFWGLNKNTRKNIQIRERKDYGIN